MSENKDSQNQDKDFLDQQITQDTFLNFLKWKIPHLHAVSPTDHLSAVVGLATKYGYKRLSDLNARLDRTEKAREAIEKEEHITSGAGHIVRAIGLEQPNARKEERWENLTLSLVEKYKIK